MFIYIYIKVLDITNTPIDISNSNTVILVLMLGDLKFNDIDWFLLYEELRFKFII